jgi:hypothetical protein
MLPKPRHLTNQICLKSKSSFFFINEEYFQGMNKLNAEFLFYFYYSFNFSGAIYLQKNGFQPQIEFL